MTKRTYKQMQVASLSVEEPSAASIVYTDTRHSVEAEGKVEGDSSQEEEIAATMKAGTHPYLEEVVTHTPDAMIALDQHFHMLDINPAASTILGWSAEKAIGHSCMEVLHCRNLNKMELCGTSSCPLVRVLQLKQPLPNEELIIGDTCEVSASITPIDVGNDEVHVVFTTRDMSALKVANRVRANFVSMVSHELRTPLNSVHGFIDLLSQGHMGKLNQEQLKYLQYTQEGVLQLIAIVEDILFMTRSDVGQFEIKQQEINFRVVAKQVVSSMEPQARKAGVVITKEFPSLLPMLYADPQRMKQVLNNLVANAIKFTPPEGTVTIRARPYNKDFVMISVTDTGYGIPLEDRAHIFERFYQSNHSSQSRMGGYGLGLSIARLIVEQHGGSINFESDLKEGTTFYFTIPAVKKQRG